MTKPIIDWGKPIIDWAPLEVYSPDVIECRCGATYVSHVKMCSHEGGLVMVTQKPCPHCGADHGHVRRASSAPERQVIS